MDPTTSLQFCNFSLSVSETPSSAPPNFPKLKIAIHLHVSDSDNLESFTCALDKWKISYDLYITTDTLKKKNDMSDSLQNHDLNIHLKEIKICSDNLPWLALLNNLDHYDIVGHFHTHNTINEIPEPSSDWRQELIDLLITPVDSILEAFSSNTDLGIIINDIPLDLKLNPAYLLQVKNERTSINKLWKRLGCVKKIDFNELPILIFPIGNMFWYRPAALRPLINLRLPNDNIPKYLNQMVIYIAWSEGFTYKISSNPKNHINSFQNQLIINNLIETYKKECDELTIERDTLFLEKERLTKDLDSLRTNISELLNSKSWRFTRPLRTIGGFIRNNYYLYSSVNFFLTLKREGPVQAIKSFSAFRKSNPQKTIDSLFYESEYQNNIDFSDYHPKVKAIAFYLPQFHTIPENDQWWGKGFTEWTNTRKTEPRFEGHYQPHEPHDDIGYYDLTNVETIKKQARLAKQHGIYGFCFHLYWFSGKRLLEKPLDLLLEHPEIDIKFCLCWANENWTRTWDGQKKKILIEQNYHENDPYKFIEDIQKYIIDNRYIKMDGKPLILVYHPGAIPDAKETFTIWRKHARYIGIGEIKIFICRTFQNTIETLGLLDVVDGEVEFPPHELGFLKKKDVDLRGKTAEIYDYNDVINHIQGTIEKDSYRKKSMPTYRTCMMGWDNAARKVSGWKTFANFSLHGFYTWVSMITDEAIEKYQEDDAFIFVNAWNEWAEGTHLEPDKKYGYANINTLSRAIYKFPLQSNIDKRIIFVSNNANQEEAQLLAINIIKQLKENFKYEIYTILITGGMLLDDFEYYSSDTIVIDEVDLTELKAWIKSANANKAICNTILSGSVVHILTELGIRCISLINETENTIKENAGSLIYKLLTAFDANYKKISVVIPNYNYSRYLKERIDSILSQTYPIFEVIIIDDSSTDDSLEIIDEYEKRYPLLIKTFKNERNSGNVFKQWAKGIEAATGDYIWIAEADDLSDPSFIETLVEKISLDDDIVFGYTQSKTIDENGSVTGENYLAYTNDIDTIWESDYISDGKTEVEKRLSTKCTILNVSAVIFKNKGLLEAVKNAEQYNLAGDWRFYVDLLWNGGKIAFISKSLNFHRRHSNSVTKTLNLQKHFEEICQMQEYVYKLTNNSEYYTKAKEYREVVKQHLGI